MKIKSKIRPIDDRAFESKFILYLTYFSPYFSIQNMFRIYSLKIFKCFVEILVLPLIIDQIQKRVYPDIQ